MAIADPYYFFLLPFCPFPPLFLPPFPPPLFPYLLHQHLLNIPLFRLSQGNQSGFLTIALGPKLDVVPFILGDFAEEFVQIQGQFGNGNPVILDVILLLEDDSIQAGAEDLYGGG